MRQEIECNINGQRFRQLGPIRVGPDTYFLYSSRCTKCGRPYPQMLSASAIAAGQFARRCEEHRNDSQMDTEAMHPSCGWRPPGPKSEFQQKPRAQLPRSFCRTGRPVRPPPAGIDDLIARGRGVNRPPLSVRLIVQLLGDLRSMRAVMGKIGVMSNKQSTEISLRLLASGWIERNAMGWGKYQPTAEALDALRLPKLPAESANQTCTYNHVGSLDGRTQGQGTRACTAGQAVAEVDRPEVHGGQGVCLDERLSRWHPAGPTGGQARVQVGDEEP